LTLFHSVRPLNSDIDASSQFGIDGEVNINSVITDFQNSLNPISPKFIVAEEALQGSCFDRRNSRQGSFVYGGAGGLPVSPSSAIDEESSLSSQLPEVQPNSQTSSSSDLGGEDNSTAAETVIYSAQTAQKWQVGEPIIEPTNLIKTADGRLLWVRKQVDNASSLICE
jgi:large exoprotein involved in heme utilization and adhesion